MEKEVQFQILDEEAVRTKLSEMGFIPTGKSLYRDVYFSETGQWETSDWYMRLRDNGEEVELTYKSQDKREWIQEREELTAHVDSYETVKEIFTKMNNMKAISEKETEKEYLKKGDIIFEFITVIKPKPFEYAEIEAEKEAEIKAVLKEIEENVKIIKQENFPS